VEIRTYFKPSGKGELDSDGNLKGIILSDLVRKIPLADVTEFLEDKDIVRLFGSLNVFNELLADSL
jgi:hypothetical protein